MAPTNLEVPARKRTVRACDQCRRRKVKCNGKLGCTECNSIGLECSYGSQIKQSRRRNYLIHLEQKVQRLEHELRSARTTSPPDMTRRHSEPSIEQSMAVCGNTGVQDYVSAGPEISMNPVSYWNTTYKPFEHHNGGSEWIGPAQTAKPLLSHLTIPSQCLQTSDFIYRADSLSPQTPQTTSSATWTPCSDSMIDFWQTNPDASCSQTMLPTMPQDAGRWYCNTFDQQINTADYHALAYPNGNMAPCPPGYN